MKSLILVAFVLSAPALANDLDGTWNMACASIDLPNLDFSVDRVLVVDGQHFLQTSRTFQKGGCLTENEATRMELAGMVVFRDSSLTTREIDFQNSSLKVTPLTDESTRRYNENHICGLTWRTGVTYDIVACFDPVTFDIFQITDDILRTGSFADEDRDGSTPAKRPIVLARDGYVRSN